jgi:hypothetical protein
MGQACAAWCCPLLLTQPKDNTMTTRSHHDNVEKQFGSQASAYLTSAVHASGRDLQRLAERLADFPQATCWIWAAGQGTPALRRRAGGAGYGI